MKTKNERQGCDMAAFVGGVLLAAGCSRRMGTQNKLLLEMDGSTIIRRAAMALLKGGVTDLVVVTGHQQKAVRTALADLPVEYAHNTDYAAGQAGSIACGVRRFEDEPHQGVLIALGDMPFIPPELINRLVDCHVSLPDNEARISYPVFAGKRGHPVIWGRHFFAALSGLSGDAGGRSLLAEHANRGNPLAWVDDSIHKDIDTPAAYAATRV